MPKAPAPAPARIEGAFQHLVYSPKGEFEGALLHCNGHPLQLVFDRHDTAAAAAFNGVRPGQTVSVQALLQGPSPKGEGAHPVHAFGKLLAVDGQKPLKPPRGVTGPAYQGTVVRLNHARHGAVNGVVLDSGDFIHTRPEGMARLKLQVGDAVRADGDAQRLADDSGWAVEASTVNGKRLLPR